MILRALLFLISLVCGLAYSTHLLVERVGIAAVPKSELLQIFALRFAPPWLWVKWFFLYGDRYWHVLQKTMWPVYVSILVGIVIAWASRIFTRRKKISTAHGSSRWAHEKELQKAGLLSKNGVVLGQTESKKIIRHDGPEHVMVVAPTRSGKGVGLVIPTLLEWTGSAVIFDPKGENWQITSGHRESLGTCLRFDPTTKQTAHFNPLMEIRQGELEVKDAQNIADIIIDPDGRLEARNHWQNAAHSLLVGVILHVLHSCKRKSLAGIVEFLTNPESSFEISLEEMKQSQHHVVKSVAQEMLNKHIEERSGVLSTAISLLAIFRDPLVAAATDEHDFKIESLKNFDKPISLFLVLPPSDISRLRMLIRLMLNQIGRVLTEKQEASKQKVLFLLDEFPALGRLEFFESALAYIAGYGLKAFLICQSLNQLQKAYGEKNSILDNCHVRVAFANNDDQTSRRISDLLGEQTLTKEQTSISGGRLAMFKRNASVSTVEFGRPLLLPSEINRLPQYQEIILVNGVYPILAHKLRYYDDKRFKDKVLAPAIVVTRTNTPDQAPINKPMPIVAQETAIGSAL
jgi:type IV secretion system protein VirD4